MAKGEQPEPGLASDLVERLSSIADAASPWLEQHEPAATAATPVTPAAPTPPTEPGPRPEQGSLGTLMSRITTNLSTLIRQEIALAKAEMTDTAKKAAKSAGIFQNPDEIREEIERTLRVQSVRT